MKLVRASLAVLVLGSVVGLAYVAQQQGDGTGVKMVAAAEKFLQGLSADQKKGAQFSYDSPERINWNFIPLQDKAKAPTRKGIRIETLSADQKAAAFELLKAGTSETGYETARLIMSLEGILNDVEKKKVNVRNPEWYFLTIFGDPSRTGKWGWRFEGHHLSINFTLEGAEVVASTPYFFGANPALIKAGPNKGKKVLAGAQDLASNLFQSLDGDQKKVALKDKAFDEPGQKEIAPKVGAAVGLSADKMSKGQKETLTALLKHYTDRMPKDLGEREFQAITKDLGKIHFAYTGATEEGKGRTYRVQGDNFVVEFLNIQADGSDNPANHIHSSLRKLKGDFGAK